LTESLNCGYCSKCSRDIVGLIVEGIDPRKCGFKIYEDFFEHTRERVVPTSMRKNWKMIQEHIKENKNSSNFPPNVREFFSWLKNYNFSEHIKEPYIKSVIYNLISYILGRSPIRIQKLVMKYLNQIRKKRHWLR
jgi:hypothetical protein